MRAVIVHFGSGLGFEAKVFLPPARQQRQYLSFPPSERVLQKQLEVSTGNFQTFESRNYSSWVAVGTSISPA